MQYDILSKERFEILPLLANFKKDFYLAGGTALALQLGHRDSVDFDFFSPKDIDTAKLFEKIREVFSEHNLVRTQEEKNTLTLIIDGNIKLSFFSYFYKLVEPLIEDEYFHLASMVDIGCMKLMAVVSRATNKDYADIYYILQQVSLKKLLDALQEKIPELDRNLVLKSLVYFSDISEEPLMFKKGKELGLETIKKFFVQEVKRQH